MDRTERQNLVNTIREVHEKLRKSLYMTNDPNKVWHEHVKEEELRKKYAFAMKKLATEGWDGKECRIQWSYKTCLDYFYGGGLERILLREKKIKELKYLESNERIRVLDDGAQIENDYLNMIRKLKLLDVGSCYNPFSQFAEFSCVAIDLTPATADVLPFDFLLLDVQKNSNTNNEDLNITFCEESFDVVVLSLVLEYLPASEQRAIFCFKAWQLLKQNGLCVIITPDSKRLHHNAPMMKSWKRALEKIGFRRVKYDKLTHLHCMAFCKISKSSEMDITSCKSVSDLLYIPQDFKTYVEDAPSVDRSEEESQSIHERFLELPNEILF